ncbi:vitrin isoform X3 [Triplophysa rosa]|uniref:vitrin isoform X3 n=1 Tax=Triplophysa rosa TaxID=992332 RepID=UPI002545EBBF|nr:vitrin isoform X3 [Triplophysa rosa]
MIKTPLATFFIAILLSCSEAKPNGKNKKQKQVVPALECDVRAGRINLPEFIVKCPANCRETKERVYGTAVFASISSICNAAIHSGVITNSGGKVIVKKMAGQAIYKGSFSNGVRSLSLPNWRESFSVSVGKPKKGVIYPSTLDYTASRPTAVKTDVSKAAPESTPWPVVAAELSFTTTSSAPPTTTTVAFPSTTTVLLITTTAKPRVTVHKVREAGTSHPYFSSVARVQRSETSSTVRRQPQVPSGSAYSRVQLSKHTAQSNPAFARRDWPHPANTDWFSGSRRPTDSSHSLSSAGYKWGRGSTVDSTAHEPGPDNTEHKHWLHNFGQYSPESDEHKLLSETSHTREAPTESWEPDSNPLESGISVRGQEPAARAPEIMTQGDPTCKVDVAFLMDGSWSIGKRRFKIQKDFLVEVSQVMNGGIAGPMMGIIQYGDDAVTEFSLKQFSNSKDLKPAISKIVQKGGLSNVGKALTYINKHFFSDANGNRGGAPNVAVVLVDGWPTDRV